MEPEAKRGLMNVCLGRLTVHKETLSAFEKNNMRIHSNGVDITEEHKNFVRRAITTYSRLIALLIRKN